MLQYRYLLASRCPFNPFIPGTDFDKLYQMRDRSTKNEVHVFLSLRDDVSRL